MQPVPSVGWDPISIDRQLAWQPKLFLIYLFVMSVIVALKMARLVVRLRSLPRRVESQLPEMETTYFWLWDGCSGQVLAMKRSVVLTFLLSVLVSADQTKEMLAGIAREKAIGIAAWSGSIAEILGICSLGILFCSVTYAGCGLCDGVLARRKAAWNFARMKA